MLLGLLSISLVSCSTLNVDEPIGIPLKPIITVKKDAFGIDVTTVRPNPVCMKEIREPSCGYYAWTISDREQYVGEAKATWLFGKPWSVLQDEAIYTPSETQAKIKEAIINTCKKYKTCDQRISRWRVKTDKLIPDKKGNP